MNYRIIKITRRNKTYYFAQESIGWPWLHIWRTITTVPCSTEKSAQWDIEAHQRRKIKKDKWDITAIFRGQK